MQEKQIQWFPGHMAKTRRLMKESLQDVDLVLELLDARIPYSSRNPEIKKILNGKPSITILNKSTLADLETSKKWCAKFEQDGTICVLFDALTGYGMQELKNAIQLVLKEKLERNKERGMENRRIRCMICGIPNVGKSSIINCLAGSKRAKVENRPGVTLNKQWISTDIGLSLLDMPGVLWPKFEDPIVGENLAVTGAIKDQILDVEELAMILVKRLLIIAPKKLQLRYKLSDDELLLDPWSLVETIGKKRGFLLHGAEVNTERTSIMLLDEFRSGTIGAITLDQLEG